MTQELKPDEIYIQLGENRISTEICLRRWQKTPFEGGVKYTRDDKDAKWKYCPECGCDKYTMLTRYADSAENNCKECGQIWFTDIDYTDVIKSNLSKTKLPKYKRVDLDEDILHNWKQGHSQFQDGYNRAIYDIKSKHGDLYAEVK